MTKLNQIILPSFKEIIRRQQQERFHLYHPASMVQRSWTINTRFCQALVCCGYLNYEQMLHAAWRYLLGGSKKGGVIFWLIGAPGDTIAIVEAEKTAVILSEHYPQYVWLASGGLYELKADKFRPLRGRKIVLFPDTDPDGKTFRYWYQTAQEVMASPFWEGSPPIRVSAILEQHATPAQKAAKIDLIDYLFTN